jgi:hypothetical protein
LRRPFEHPIGDGVGYFVGDLAYVPVLHVGRRHEAAGEHLRGETVGRGVERAGIGDGERGIDLPDELKEAPECRERRQTLTGVQLGPYHVPR